MCYQVGGDNLHAGGKKRHGGIGNEGTQSLGKRHVETLKKNTEKDVFSAAC